MMRAMLSIPAALTLLVSSITAQDFDLSNLQLPEGFLDLSNIELTVRSDQTVTATAYATLLNANTFVLLSSMPATASQRGLILGLKPDDWSLANSAPALAGPPFDGLTLSNVGLVITDQDIRAGSSMLHPQEYEFYREIYQTEQYELVLTPGINLIGAIPVAELEPGHPLLFVMDALGIEKGVVLLQGTLGRSLTLIGAPGAGGADVIRDLFLRAELPPLRPPNSPEWFRSGQLALELSGAPSVAVAGEMTVIIDEQELTFRIAATLAKTGVSLTGGLKAAEPWESPFGIEWLTFNEIGLLLGITPAGSVSLGFTGDMVIGEKDIDVTVLVAVSPTGVPTNFMFDGESEEGVALSDLVQVQQRMAAAAARAAEAAGEAPPDATLIPIDQLPDIGIAKMALKFAPKDSPELDVERGFRIAGDLMLATTPGAEPSTFAAVDVGVGDGSLWAKGELGAFTLGPLEWEDALLDLELSAEEQHFILSGAASLFGASQMLDVNINRESLSFRSSSRLYDFFTADIAANAAFNLRAPSFRIDAVVHNDFATTVLPMITEGLVEFLDGGQEAIDDVGAALEELDALLADQTLTVQRVRERVQAQRDRAAQKLAEVQAEAAAARSAMLAAQRARDAARNTYRNTSAWRAALKAQRLSILTRRVAEFNVARARFYGRAAAVTVRREILAALPPVDQSLQVLAAEAALRVLRDRVQTAQTRLNNLSTGYQLAMNAISGATPPVTVEHAELHANLVDLQNGGAADWLIRGTFAGSPYEIQQSINFRDQTQAVLDMIDALLRNRG